MQRLAYLISRYPAVSHTFILREICELRRLGIEVCPISINPPDRPAENLTSEERAEAERTFFVKSAPPAQLAGAVLRSALLCPMGVCRGLLLAFQLGGLNPKDVLMRLFYLFEALVAGDWMRRQKLRHLHVHFATPAATVALFVRRVFGVPFSLTVHGPDEFYNVEHYHLAEKIRAATFLCCIGRYCRSQLMKLSEPHHWPKLELSPLGVDSARFQNERPAGSGSVTRILCVGRLVPAKGQAVLLAAIRLLVDKGRRVELLLAGDGPDRLRLEALATEYGVHSQCEFSGSVNPDRVQALYARADVFVLPSFAEGIPVVLMEAMAMGIPCVSTTVNGISELIESGKQGLLVPPSDAEALCAAIERLIDDGALRASIREAARARVMSHYELSTNVRRLSEIFRARLSVTA